MQLQTGEGDFRQVIEKAQACRVKVAKKQGLSSCAVVPLLASFLPLPLAKVDLIASGFARDQGVNAPDLINLDSNPG